MGVATDSEYRGPSRENVWRIIHSQVELAVERCGVHQVVEVLAGMAPKVGADCPRLKEFAEWYERLAGRVRDEVAAGNLVASGGNGNGGGGKGATPSQEQLHQVDTLLGLIMDGSGKVCEAVDVGRLRGVTTVVAGLEERRN